MFHLEALESSIVKPGSNVGTGVYETIADSASELRANPEYYLGPPQIERITVSNYPSLRAAWAEALRNNLDMLYEVGPDALDSMERSTTISTFVFTRPYQHVMVLNARAKALRSIEFRQALNAAIDRAALVRSALNGHGIVSSGPISPKYWALPEDVHEFKFDAGRAVELTDRASRTAEQKLHFTCLAVPNTVNERVALEIKRQLATFGIDMAIESVSQEDILRPAAKGGYEAALLELVSGPTLLRPYIVWSSASAFNLGGFGNATVDTALTRARNAVTEDDYRNAVAGVQQAFMDDPPAIFLAWSQRARAVSKRFTVPSAEPGRDILATLRLWKPIADDRHATRN